MAADKPDMADLKVAAQDPDAGAATDPTFGVDEKKLLRKLDLHIIPLVMLLC